MPLSPCLRRTLLTRHVVARAACDFEIRLGFSAEPLQAASAVAASNPPGAPEAPTVTSKTAPAMARATSGAIFDLRVFFQMSMDLVSNASISFREVVATYAIGGTVPASFADDPTDGVGQADAPPAGLSYSQPHRKMLATC